CSSTSASRWRLYPQPSGLSEEPKAGKSIAQTRKRALNGSATSNQSTLLVGNPCTSTSGGASASPSSTWKHSTSAASPLRGLQVKNAPLSRHASARSTRSTLVDPGVGGQAAYCAKRTPRACQTPRVGRERRGLGRFVM